MEIAILGSDKQNTRADSQSFKRLFPKDLTIQNVLSLKNIFEKKINKLKINNMYYHLSYIFIE